MKIKSSDIANFLKKDLNGKNIIISNLSSHSKLKKNHFFFYERNDPDEIKKINKFKENILCICNKKNNKYLKTSYIISNNPRLDCIKIMKKFFSRNENKKKINQIHKTVKIGLNCFIGNDVRIGKGTEIGNNVILENRVSIGKNCIVKSGCVIGSDGFGPIIKNNKIIKMQPHYGGVKIENDVYIGPLSNIERGTIEDTIISSNVSIDALVQIGHNSIIKKNSVITSGSLVGGSVTINEGSWIAPNSTIKERVKLAKNTYIGYASNVLKDTVENSLNYGNPSKKIK